MNATLFVHPLSPFARKAMLINRLAALSIPEIRPERVGDTGYAADHNPLGKIPSLIVDGDLIVDSPNVCEWLDQRGKRWLAEEEDLIAARSLHAIGDGLATAVYNYRYETVRDESLHWPQMIQRNNKSIQLVVEFLESRIEALSGPIVGASWGGLAVMTALDYADFRASHIDWRAMAPKLAAWHAPISASNAFMECNVYTL